MARYKNIGGKHTTADGRVIKHGEVFEDSSDPRKLFANKFELVPDRGAPAPAPEAAPVTPATKEEAAPAPVTGSTPAPAADAKDVTADFAVAKENALTVKKDKAGYWIQDDGDAVNENAIKNKDGVKKAIVEYLK